MKTKNIAVMLAIAAAGMAATSCENDNINPYDYNNNGSSNENQGSADVLKTAIAEYPAGSVVWTRDTAHPINQGD